MASGDMNHERWTGGLGGALGSLKAPQRPEWVEQQQDRWEWGGGSSLHLFSDHSVQSGKSKFDQMSCRTRSKQKIEVDRTENMTCCTK